MMSGRRMQLNSLTQKGIPGYRWAYFSDEWRNGWTGGVRVSVVCCPQWVVRGG
jgi:hypothetical protein